jgi:hypothetical protein
MSPCGGRPKSIRSKGEENLKVIIASAAVLILSLLLCVANIFVVHHKTDAILSLLDESLTSVLDDDLDKGRERLTEAQNLWDRDKTYFNCVLRHSETDEIYTLFRTALGSLESEDKEGFGAQCAELISHIELVQETESFTFGNVM